jgi:hypothetical protein
MDTTAIVLGVGGLLATLGGTLGATELQARAQRVRERTVGLGAVLDGAAVSLAESEEYARRAWRALLELDATSHSDLDSCIRDTSIWPDALSSDSSQAVQDFAEHLGKSRAMAARLAVRLRRENPVYKACESAQEGLSSVATAMTYVLRGDLGRGDLEEAPTSSLRRSRPSRSFTARPSESWVDASAPSELDPHCG